jgi:hypothetical protein
MQVVSDFCTLDTYMELNSVPDWATGEEKTASEQLVVAGEREEDRAMLRELAYGEPEDEHCRSSCSVDSPHKSPVLCIPHCPSPACLP